MASLRLVYDEPMNRYRLLATVTFCLGLNSLPVCGEPIVNQTGPLVNSAAGLVGVSADRLARIDRMCEEAIAKGKVPGIVALVARHGRIVYHKAFGMADSEADRSLKTTDIFRIASQTKAITSTAVMMLWEEGLFQLDDPIAKFIPEFKDTGVLKTFNEEDVTWTTDPVKSPITIRHLLTHTSGLGYGVIDGDSRFKKM